jgi:RNA polymerase sigma-70 factor (ECF subfamily)
LGGACLIDCSANAAPRLRDVELDRVRSRLPVPTRDVTALLKAWTGGDATALEQLVPLVHRELHRIARNCMAGERTGHSLQPTALLNETYLRFPTVAHLDWQDRGHFFAMSARLMRRILVDVARAKKSRKRGGGRAAAPMDAATSVAIERPPDLVALDLALQVLAQFDLRKSRIVELRFFGGLTVDETAHVLGVSPETVQRDWRLAKSWLRRELQHESADGR